MPFKIDEHTTSAGKGTLFDIYFYVLFAVAFYTFAVVDFFRGDYILASVALLIAIFDTVIVVSNIYKRKANKS